MQSVLGVDVSKAKLDVALSLSTEKFRSKVFTNDARGFNSLVQWLQATAPGSFEALHVCMEATGSFHEALACFLHEQGVAVSVVNPLLVKRFAEANRLRNKTDGADAKCLAMFCRANRPQRWEAPRRACAHCKPWSRGWTRCRPCARPNAIGSMWPISRSWTRCAA